MVQFEASCRTLEQIRLIAYEKQGHRMTDPDRAGRSTKFLTDLP